jgi:phosphoribosylanthranilate isomerase
MRFIGNACEKHNWDALPVSIKRTGVFVNDRIENIKEKATTYGLNVLQLHGEEPPRFCHELRNSGRIIIKSIPVSGRIDNNQLRPYKGEVDYFLFDTATAAYGGSGTAFNWSLLQAYDLDIPFFISGGIGTHNIQEVLKINHPMLQGIDANSCIESAPGIKNITLTKTLIHAIRQHSVSTGR